ncbi:MAG: HAD family hydrolase [Planctomycetales bacterium]|nr:HAD family hydrolase [Planctomycetales bacterium]
MPAAESRREFFVGVDSDGCVFDTMELKWKECFIPEMIRHYHLQAVSRLARETAEFVNLYSQDRGCNRFFGLIKTLDLLARRPEVDERGFAARCCVPESLRHWVAQETKLSQPALAAAAEATGDAALAAALAWSREVNASIAATVSGVPPFPHVEESLAALAAEADVIVCSATPTAALQAEWGEHGLDRHVGQIYGQEAGSKREILAAAARYTPQRALMIGDAPGDYRAAEANGCLFFPIIPGQETQSWAAFAAEGLPRFLSGQFAGEYHDRLVRQFLECLPAQPPWLQTER